MFKLDKKDISIIILVCISIVSVCGVCFFLSQQFSLAENPNENDIFFNSTINYDVEKLLNDIVQEIQLQHRENIQIANLTILDCSSLSISKESKYELLIKNQNILSNLITVLSNSTNITIIAQEIKTSFLSLHLQNMQNQMSDFFNQLDYFESFIDKTIVELKVKQWSNVLTNLERELTEAITALENDFRKKIEDQIDDVVKILDKVVEDLGETIKEYVKSLDVQDVADSLRRKKDTFDKAMLEMDVTNYPLELSSIISDWEQNDMHSLRLRLSVGKLKNSGTKLRCLGRINKNFTAPDREQWKRHLEKIVNILDSTEQWNEFLVDLYEVFSSYDIQKDPERYDVLKNWSYYLSTKQGTNNNTDSFLSRLASFNLSNYENVKKMEIDELKINDLQVVMGSTLDNPTVVNCDKSGSIIINGDNIRLSDFVDNNGLPNVCRWKESEKKSVIFFGYNSIIFDRDINLKGYHVNLTVVAPKWHITGKVTIKLDGQVYYKVNSFCQNSKQGIPAGNFFGIFDGIENQEELTVLANDGVISRELEIGHVPASHEYFNLPWECRSFFVKQDGECHLNGNVTIIDLRTSASKIKQVVQQDETCGRYHRYSLCSWIYDFSTMESMRVQSCQIIRQRWQYQSVFYYKNLLRSYFYNRWKREQAKKFTYQIENIMPIKELDTVELLLYEYQDFQEEEAKQQLSLRDRMDIYQSFLNQKVKETKDSSELKVLSYLRTSIITKIMQLKTDMDGSLIIDIDKYTAQLLENIKQIQKNNAIKISLSNYQQTIQSKITEANNFIKNDILFEIASSGKQFDDHIKALLNEISQLITKVEHETSKLLEKKEKLQSQLASKFVFGFMKIVGKIVSCFGFVGAIYGESIKFGATVADSVLGKDLDPSSSHSIPYGIINIKILDETINEIKGYHNPATNKNKRSLKNETKDALKGVGRQLPYDALAMYDQYRNQKEKIKEIDDAIEKNIENVKKIHTFEKQIITAIIPLLEKMSKNIKEVAQESKEKSKVALEITNWGVQKYLKDIKRQMKKITTGFEVEEKVQISFDNLSEAFTTLIKIYSQIQEYADQQLQADFIAEVSSPTMHAIFVNDSKLQSAVDLLDNKIRSNLVLQQYEKAEKALKQAVFPLAQLYLVRVREVISLEASQPITDLISAATMRVEKIQSKLAEYKATIQNHDKYLQCGMFNSQYNATEPFFSWRHREHGFMIEKLLSGESVMAYADVTKAKDNYAVKFNSAGLYIKTHEKSDQTKLDYVLQGFHVLMTHMGNSYYNYQNAIYVFTSSSQYIKYSYQRDKDGTPVVRNEVYKKMMVGDLILSPYAMWKIQLIPIKNKGDVESLSSFKNMVDLELVGHGCFMTADFNYDSLDVDSYYKRDDSF